MKKNLYPIVVAIVFAIGILIGNFYARRANSFNTLINQYNNKDLANTRNNVAGKVSDLFQLLNDSYVDSLALDSIAEKVVPNIMSQLDPHSVYIPASELQAVNDELSTGFGGIGIQFNMMTDTIQVIQIVKGGAAEQVGILPDDRIIAVNDSNIAGIKKDQYEVMKMLKGDIGTKVNVTVLRPNVDSLLHFTLTRSTVKVNSIDAAYLIAPQVGYISINKFAQGTYAEFLTALAQIKAQKANQVIIDLRNNGGGMMDQCIKMLNEFLPRNSLMVYVEGYHTKREEWTANGAGSALDMAVIVLIDEFSASASEIFAGAIQDNERGLILGRRSFGKGLVQTQMPFRDGSAVRMTIARYYTPSGRCIQKPYKMGDIEDYELDILNRYEHGEFFNADSIHQNDSLAYKTKLGRTVYGGGGIMPDIFIPRDTTSYTQYLRIINNKYLPYKFAMKYTQSHRNELNKKKDWRALKEYLLNNRVMEEFNNYCLAEGVKMNQKEYTKSKDTIEHLVVGLIIRNILDDAGYFPYINSYDECVLKALDVLKLKNDIAHELN